eukprot:754766-Amorphochlora_amoeboformis.AAC.1
MHHAPGFPAKIRACLTTSRIIHCSVRAYPLPSKLIIIQVQIPTDLNQHPTRAKSNGLEPTSNTCQHVAYRSTVPLRLTYKPLLPSL